MPYSSFRTKAFEKCLEKHKDKKDRIEGLIGRILSDPYLSSHLLTARKGVDLRGKRSKHLARNFVFVYIVCEECIQAGFRDQGFNNCYFCEGQPLQRVVFLAFGTHEDIYRREWQA